MSSAHNGKPYIDESVLDQFFSKIEYPMYFLDYETYSSAIPLVDGVRPHSPIPFQYSLHVKRSPSDLNPLHIEYLSDKAELPLSLLQHLQKNIGPVGSVVSWHASFENTQNRNMSDLYPSNADFLHDLIARTIDLEDLFKDGYVDIAFGGSTSIKNILPVINGLSNFSHPCQILTDIFTIEEKLGTIKGKKISWLGDYNNVLISLIHAAEIFEFTLNILVPKSFLFEITGE